MANVKISALPAATTPLAGTEEVPLVQSTTTKKVTVDSINANATLQQVTAGTNKDLTNDRNLQGTDAGNNNTGDRVNALGNGALKNNTANDVNALGTDAGVGNSFASVNFLGNNTVADADNQTVFGNFDGSTTLNARLSYKNISDNRKYELPDASGTLVLSVNGNAPDPQGNVTVAVSAPYLVYTALLDQDGTATVLQNTLGTTINWTNPSNGVMRGTAASGSPFTQDKTWISSGSYNNSGTPYFVTGQPRNLTPTQAIELFFYKFDGTITGTPNFNNYSLEIRVYP